MNHDDALNEVRQLAARIFEREADSLDAGTRLWTDLECESIDLLELGAGLSRRFGIVVDDEAAFLQSLRAKTMNMADIPSVIAAEYPHLDRDRVASMSASLERGDATPLLCLGDIAAYVSHAVNQA